MGQNAQAKRAKELRRINRQMSAANHRMVSRTIKKLKAQEAAQAQQPVEEAEQVNGSN